MPPSRSTTFGAQPVPAGDDDVVWTVVVGAGSGRRFGGLKQYELIAGGRILDVAVATARDASDGVVVVVPPDDAEREGGVPGADTRTGSVRAGLCAVPDEATVICVHDAARPFASASLFAAVIDAVRRGADGAVPGVPVTDTVKRIDASATVVETLPRAELVAVQTPQAFRAAVLRAAHERSVEATDDAALVEACGGRVVVVAGEPDNRKITDAADLDWARRQVAR